MIRCTIELLPGGREEGKRTIGLVEIANVSGSSAIGGYVAILKKTPPFTGALKQAWRRGVIANDGVMATGLTDVVDDDLLTATIEGHHRTRRGVYDLLYRALKACGLEDRVPTIERKVA